MKIFVQSTVSAGFWAIPLKLCANCAFPQNFQTRILGEIAVFYAAINVKINQTISEKQLGKLMRGSFI